MDGVDSHNMSVLNATEFYTSRRSNGKFYEYFTTI